MGEDGETTGEVIPASEDEVARSLEALPEEERQRVVERYVGVASVTKIEGYAGPLPPAGDFEKYERTLLGAADRILTIAETEQQLRGSLLKEAQRTERLLVVSSTLIAVLVICAAGLATWLGHWGIAIPLGLVGFASPFLRNIIVGLLHKRDNKPPHDP